MSKGKPQMAEPEPYEKRRHRAARQEFKKFWTAYRYWTIAASFIASLALQFTRSISRTQMNLQDILINGLLGAPLALILSLLLRFTYYSDAANAPDGCLQGSRNLWKCNYILQSSIGTYFIAMRKAAEVLDDQLQAEVLKRNGIITGLNAELEESKRNPAQEYYYRLAEEEIAKWSDICKQVVRHIYATERLFAGPEIAHFPGLDSDKVVRCLNSELRDSKVVIKRENSDRGIKIWWEIVPAYKSAISKLLYTDSNS